MLTDSERAALARRLRRGREAGATQIPRRPAGLTELPLSFGQEQLWFIDRFAPGLPTYNIPIALQLSGTLDTAALRRGLAAVVARHEALRTRLGTVDGGRPAQVISAPAAVPLGVTDLPQLTPGPRQAALREFITAEAARPFSLAEGPLLRASLIQLAETEHVLLLVVHHVVFDGWSARVLVRDLAALYEQEASGEPAGLGELPVQFADYALWERHRLSGSFLSDLEDYWRSALAGFETVQLPTDRPRPVVDNFAGAIAQRMTGPGLLGSLQELSRREGTTLFVALMAGLQALLQRYTGQRDLVVGTVSANRSMGELTPMVGFLVNTLPIRADLSGDPTFTELLARLRAATVGAYAHQDLPFGKMVETLGVERDPSRAPVFQIALTYAERDSTPVRGADVAFTVTDLVVGIDAAKFDLTFLAEARGDGLWFECSYKTALFDAATIERMLAHLEVLLRGAASDPAARLSQLPVLTGPELEQELAEWNDTAAALPPRCVHQAFEAQAAATPDAVAVEFGAERQRYAELNRQASQIARRLRELGAGPEALIGVCMPASPRRLAALLAVWKAGGGYVPLDPALPPERMAFLLADTGMAVVITDAASASRVPAGPDITMLCLDTEWEQLSGLDGSNLAGPGASPDNTAYVIYTSGSTGQPKGVVVEHRQAINLLQGMATHWKVGPADAVLQFSSFTFDVSVMDMFMPLLSGARVVLAPAPALHSPPRLAALLREARITFACLPPAVLNLLGDGQFPALRVLMAAGEELPSDLARRWIRPGLRFVNGYGPTEATVIATYAELEAGTRLPPPIGRPTWPNYQVYVLDPDLNPVPVGVTGELHIGGAGVARGYLNRPELTRERFIADPFRGDPGARLYKTGDRVLRRPDGTIVFLGRIDGQVKIHGLRVELGEIETALASHPGVAQAIVTVVTDQAGDKQLAAYLRPEPAASPASPAQLRDHLAWLLPGYLIPAYLTTVEVFPLNSSGKVDRGALPAPPPPAAAGGGQAPRTLLETALVDFYATVLGRDQLGVTDSFFDIGGNSLAAMRLISLLDDELEVDISVAAVFLAPTPAQLAALLRDKHGFDDVDLGADGLDEQFWDEEPGTEVAGV
jgi:amino acid adenylation domain-containing protein